MIIERQCKSSKEIESGDSKKYFLFQQKNNSRYHRALSIRYQIDGIQA